eukprot:sb/3463469/
MDLESTEIFVDLDTALCQALQGSSVLCISHYLGHRGLVTRDAGSNLVASPGCRSDNVLVSGVANTCRHLILSVDPRHPLLGLHAGCLSGTKEVSPWTRYLEVELPCQLSTAITAEEIGKCLGKIEETLETPFIGHNQRKIRQEAMKLGILPDHGVVSHDEWQALPIIRPYLHGLHLGATDLLVLGMVLVKLRTLKLEVSDIPGTKLLQEWLARVIKCCDVTTLTSFFNSLHLPAHSVACSCNNLSADVSAAVPPTTLDEGTLTKLEERFEYRVLPNIVTNWDALSVLLKPQRDHSVACSCNNLSTDVSAAVPPTTLDEGTLTKLEERFEYRVLPNIVTNWDALSVLLKPQRGNKNNTNKMHQLASILRGVQGCVDTLSSVDPARTLRIVDFCSGAGHLGIFLAYHFPQCEVSLVETKWGSLRYAKERVDKLGLSNVTVCLCHLAQFTGRFDIGVSLHACGSATDAVLSQCVRVGAAVVSSPCCYGKITPSPPTLSYPRSDLVQEVLTESAYYATSRQADHMSENETAMKCIDIDRLEFLKDNGYQSVSISKLEPLTCSPKNNLLVAVK